MGDLKGKKFSSLVVGLNPIHVSKGRKNDKRFILSQWPRREAGLEVGLNKR